MIKLLVVDDEPPIGRAVKAMIEKASDAFEVVGCELNGFAALERMAQEPIDVVITDIRMPVMDGIAFLEKAEKRYPDCISVILSGYQEFAHAQAAIKLGAFDYLLKPLTMDKISDLLNRIEDLWTLRIVAKKRETLLESMRGISFVRNGSAAKCSVLLACAGAWPLSPDDAMVPGATFWESVPFACEQLLHTGEDVIAFEGKVMPERIFVFDGLDRYRFQEVAPLVYDRLKDLGLPLAVTVCAFPDPAEIWEVGYLVRALRAKLYTSVRLCRSQFIWDVAGELSPAASVSNLSVDPIVESILAKDSGTLKTCMERFVTTCVQGNLTQMEFCRFLDSILCDQRLQIPSNTGIKLDLNGAVSNAVTTEGLAADIFAILDHFSSYKDKGAQQDLIWQIEQYLKINMDKAITNEMLSKRFGFVPSYVSKLFRRHKGMSPSEYIIKLRMEKAKETMQRYEGILIKNVSQLVGYNDPHYFSKIFKKETGQWPSQFQENIRK